MSDQEFEVNWSIASLAMPYNKETKRCQLCKMEKSLIAKSDPANALNRRWEIMTRCRYEDKVLPTNYWVSEYQTQGLAGLDQQPAEEPLHPPPPLASQDHGEEQVHMEVREDAPAGGGLLVDGGGPVTRAKAREMKKSSSRE